jgi:hypothetical protein
MNDIYVIISLTRLWRYGHIHVATRDADQYWSFSQMQEWIQNPIEAFPSIKLISEWRNNRFGIDLILVKDTYICLQLKSGLSI